MSWVIVCVKKQCDWEGKLWSRELKSMALGTVCQLRCINTRVKISANEKRPYMCNFFCHWLRFKIRKWAQFKHMEAEKSPAYRFKLNEVFWCVSELGHWSLFWPLYACCLFITKPLTQPTLDCWHMEPQKKLLRNFEKKNPRIFVFR